MATRAAAIDATSVRAFTIPTDLPEADGTMAWHKTTLVVVELTAGGQTGLGYTYADASLVPLIRETLAPTIATLDAYDIPRLNATLWGAVRNLGRSGMAACAISALDIACWDLKARLLGLPLALLLGRRRNAVPVYGSGGFTTYDDRTLEAQLSGWVERNGCRAVKMKIGSEPSRDPARVRVARRAIGDAALFVDANGAFDPRGALRMAEKLEGSGVTWFEEPVSSDDRAGMAHVRTHIGVEMDVAAGEYSYTIDDTRMMLEAQATDVQQVDITRAGGVTGFLQAANLCDAYHIDTSAHCAPAAHLHAACAVPRLRNLEWFHDHVRIEQMLFDGAPEAKDGMIRPDLSRNGHGLTLKTKEAEAYAV
ncbi:MAG: mandelate racemase [Proteobacteria bacterium]|nr:mandelate racemase [Pseudomonadota bacterium]